MFSRKNKSVTSLDISTTEIGDKNSLMQQPPQGDIDASDLRARVKLIMDDAGNFLRVDLEDVDRAGANGTGLTRNIIRVNENETYKRTQVEVEGNSIQDTGAQWEYRSAMRSAEQKSQEIIDETNNERKDFIRTAGEEIYYQVQEGSDAEPRTIGYTEWNQTMLAAAKKSQGLEP